MSAAGTLSPVSKAHTVLIASGAYVSAEIAAEFGRIPPAFLPIGNRRLYRWQVEAVRRSLPDAPVYLSLPADFEPEAEDLAAFSELGVTVARAPEGASLGASLTFVALSAGLVTGAVTILHGDTLLQDYPYDRPDAVSVGVTRTYYPWADYHEQNGRLSFPAGVPEATDRTVLTGAFSLSDMQGFLRALALSGERFVDAVGLYSQARPLACLDEGRWFDFGHLHTYFQSRRRVTTERHFNRLEIEAAYLVKSSSKREKIQAERAWFGDLPDPLKVYAPVVVDAPAPPGGAAYRIEYHHLTTLNDLFVFGRLPTSVWRSVFEACSEFLGVAGSIKPPPTETFDSRALYLDKTLERLEQFAREQRVDLDGEWRFMGRPTPSLRRIAEQVAGAIPTATPDLLGVIHGDFCFSNILFDFRAQRIRVIDPRGVDAEGRPSIYGDVRYETGKLHHSVVGMYDHIIAGRFQYRQVGERSVELQLPRTDAVRSVQRLFQSTPFGGRLPSALQADRVSTLLFLSMLPLHADDPARQNGLLANALRLFLELEDAGA